METTFPMCLHSLHAPRQTKIRRAPIGIKKIKIRHSQDFATPRPQCGLSLPNRIQGLPPE